MSIKDGLNWLKKQAAQAPSLSNWDSDVPYWQQNIKPPFSEDDYIAQANQKAHQDRAAQAQYEADMSRVPMGTPPTEPTNPLDLQADPGHGSAPAPATDHMIDTNNATPVSEIDAGIGDFPSDNAEGDPMSFDAAEFGQQPPTTSATPIPTDPSSVADTFNNQVVHMHHGNSSPEERAQNSELGTGDMSPELPGLQQDMEAIANQPQQQAQQQGGAWSNPVTHITNEVGNTARDAQSQAQQQPQQQPQQQAQQQAQQPAPSSGGIPSSNATVAQDVMEQGIVSQPPANTSRTPGSTLAGTEATAQTQAMPNGSIDYSRIFGRGFKADSGSASDKWLAGQAAKLLAAGYSHNQISTMLGPDAWRKYGRRGQDYQVNTKRYTKPLGMKSASASDDLWAKQAGLNDEFDDLYVRSLRVGLWDKYNG